MPALRLFIAVDLPESLRDRLLALQTNIPGATWVKRPALHLTLRFLGDVEQAQIAKLNAALSAIQAEPFPMALSGVGRFPPNERRSARVLWVGIARQPALLRLAASVESAVVGLGFPPDDHDEFSPHITLARLKEHRDAAGAVSRFLSQHQGFRADPFSVESFVLYSSTLTPQGAIYKPVESFKLAQQA